MRIPFIFVHSSYVLIYGFLARTYTENLNFNEWSTGSLLSPITLSRMRAEG